MILLDLSTFLFFSRPQCSATESRNAFKFCDTKSLSPTPGSVSRTSSSHFLFSPVPSSTWITRTAIQSWSVTAEQQLPVIAPAVWRNLTLAAASCPVLEPRGVALATPAAALRGTPL